MNVKVPYINLSQQHERLHDELMLVISQNIKSGQFILGQPVKDFEDHFAKMHDVKYAVSVANGTDALVLALKALGIKENDEVITCPNSYLASASSIVLAGAKPIFCDVLPDMNMDPESLKKVITKNTKAIIPVHLTGKPAAMEEINKIADQHDLFVIEDAAQAVGAKLKGKSVGGFGDIGCFSLHPLKNLSACGDGGVMTTNDEKLYNYLMTARNHGLVSRDECSFFSVNSRLDTLQAVILNVKLKYINTWNERRREIAHMYDKGLRDLVKVPELNDDEYAVFHTYIIQNERRDELMEFLASKGIESKIHYPIAIHKQKAWMDLFPDTPSFKETEKQSEMILSLPVFPELSNDQINYVIESIQDFFK